MCLASSFSKPGLSVKKEWIVSPFTLTAEIPVGAKIIMRLSATKRICSKRVDFPVPALPVTKTC